MNVTIPSEVTRHRRQRPVPCKRQAPGFVLFIALIFLLILTLLGVLMFSSGSNEQRMAGNFQQKTRALLAADSAIGVAQQAIAQSTITQSASCSGLVTTPRICPYNSLPNPVLDTSWVGSTAVAVRLGSATFGGTIGAGSSPNAYASYPEYNIEQIPGIPAFPGYNLGSGQQYGGGSPQIKLYRITGWGLGGNANAVAVVQSLYLVP